MPTLTRQRPPSVARALRDAQAARERSASAAALRAASRRRARTPSRRRPADGARAPQGMQTLLALVGLAAERVGELGSWAGDRTAALRTGAGRAATHARTGAAWPELRAALHDTLAAAPAWIFQAAVIPIGLALTVAAALTSARAAMGPEAAGSQTLVATFPPLLAMVLAMASVLFALYRLMRGGEHHGPVWLIGLATLAFVAV